MDHTRPISYLFIFVISTVNSKFVRFEISPMTGFELRASGIWSNYSANWATITAHNVNSYKTNTNYNLTIRNSDRRLTELEASSLLNIILAFAAKTTCNL